MTTKLYVVDAAHVMEGAQDVFYVCRYDSDGLDAVLHMVHDGEVYVVDESDLIGMPLEQLAMKTFFAENEHGVMSVRFDTPCGKYITSMLDGKQGVDRLSHYRS
jgi:hypothetical protein